MKISMWVRSIGMVCLVGGGLNITQAQSVVQFSASVYNATEDMPHAAFWVQRASELQSVVSVDVFTTTNGTAAAGGDYQPISTVLTFLAGETNKAVIVPILNDGAVESIKTFQVALTNASGGAVLGPRSSATVRITDNDGGLQLELANYLVNEDAGTLQVRILRRDDGNFPVSVDYATSNLTAVAGQDYVATEGTLTFAAGETLKPVTFTLINDAEWESNKTFRISLSNPSGEAFWEHPRQQL
jgi:hypothetical protein